ncbi:NADH-quinone oxidoreductase subunit C [Streptomyces sp. RS10V-4]|uniref:NADH-quinone oxidoreductase subunit C n=1 Tax=Streptomyces rhizoryzae TaxID=2932493 RepID=UPI0020059149|nr:NADH-quinone oxidoreductase subunit C [Streptomyces rhizoryzae]MCK7623671.1 NADH-quinone oxidoreductase subunit C [Streptomyces rhizoryzae]
MSEQPDRTEQPDQPAQPSPEPAGEPAPQPVGWLPAPAAEIFGAGAAAELAYGLLTVDVPADAWTGALTAARDELGCTYFDWLSAVDEPGTGFRICAHLADVSRPGAVRRLVVRTTVPHDAPVLPTAVGVFAGAGWHERETHEMFGVDFTGHPHLVPLLLPETFEGHPLRKDFVLAARVAKAWPGAKEPGEPAAGAGPKRRQMLPPGVPDPNEWGPLKGQLPPAPARPARGARAAGAAGERPARRTRTAGAGSASQQAAAAGTPADAAAGAPPARPERPARRTRSASEGSASQQAAAAEPAAPATEAPATEAPAPRDAAAPRSSDAPWHHARPAFGAEAEREPDRAPEAQPDRDRAPEAQPDRAPEPPARPARRPDDEGGDTP